MPLHVLMAMELLDRDPDHDHLRGISGDNPGGEEEEEAFSPVAVTQWARRTIRVAQWCGKLDAVVALDAYQLRTLLAVKLGWRFDGFDGFALGSASIFATCLIHRSAREFPPMREGSSIFGYCAHLVRLAARAVNG